MPNDPTGSFTISSSLSLGPLVDGEPASSKPTPGIHLSASIMVPPLGAPLEYHWRNLSREVAAEILKNPAFFTTERPSEYSAAHITLDCLILTKDELQTAMRDAYRAGYLAGQHSANYRG